jgi:hypothetical protein
VSGNAIITEMKTDNRRHPSYISVVSTVRNSVSSSQKGNCIFIVKAF